MWRSVQTSKSLHFHNSIVSLSWLPSFNTFSLCSFSISRSSFLDCMPPFLSSILSPPNVGGLVGRGRPRPSLYATYWICQFILVFKIKSVEIHSDNGLLLLSRKLTDTVFGHAVISATYLSWVMRLFIERISPSHYRTRPNRLSACRIILYACLFRLCWFHLSILTYYYASLFNCSDFMILSCRMIIIILSNFLRFHALQS